MSNPGKTKVDEKEDADENWSDAESAMREIVHSLPALQRHRENVVVSRVTEEEANLNEQAVVAAELVMAAAEEAVMKERSEGKKKKKPRKTKKSKDDAGGSSVGGEMKKTKRRSAELTNPPKGPPECNICGKGFGSWKAVFGHMRCHKDRNYQGFFPPPKFSAAAERPLIPGPNSAFGLVTVGGVSSGGFVSADGGGDSGGERGRGLGIDLNVDPVEEGEEEESESEYSAKFDLNKSPPKDEEQKDKAK